MYPSMNPSIRPTSMPVISTETKVAGRVEVWEDYGYVLIAFCIIAAIIGSVTSFLFEKICKKGK